MDEKVPWEIAAFACSRGVWGQTDTGDWGALPAPRVQLQVPGKVKPSVLMLHTWLLPQNEPGILFFCVTECDCAMGTEEEVAQELGWAGL